MRRVGPKVLTAGYRARRWATIRKASALARLNGARIDFDVHPSVRFGAGCLFPTYPGTRTTVAIGAGTSVGEGVQFNLRGGSVRVGERSQVRRMCTMNLEGDLTVGSGVVLSVGTFVHCNERVSIGDDTIIGEYTTIADSNHVRTTADVPVHSYVRSDPVSIGRNIWVSTKVVITAGVTIGDQCVVGANSVVTADAAPSTLVAGIPARSIRTLDPEEVRPAVEASG